MTEYWQFAAAVAIAAAVIGALWYAARPQCALLMALEEGRLRLVRGKTTAAFLAAAQSICEEFGVRQGEIRGHWRGRQIALAFSPSIPAEAQQRLRNVWLLDG